LEHQNPETTLAKNAIDLPDPIQWHEGMLLAPQHFQQSSTRSELLVQTMAMVTSPFGWGVLQFEFDRPTLVGGMLRVLNLEAVMPDGLLVTAGSERDFPLELDLKPCSDRTPDDPIFVSLTVPEQKALSSFGESARYVSAQGPKVVDGTSGEGELYIPRLRPRLELHTADQVTQKFQSLPLFKVRVEGQAFTVDEYIPPLLKVSKGSPLAILCGDVVINIRERAQYLSARVHGRNFDGSDPEAETARPALASLAAGLPLLEAMLGSEAHPYSVYLALCSLAGQVAPLSHDLVPPQFEPYDHKDLRASFQPVVDFIQKSLREGVSETWAKIPFDLRDGLFQLQPNQLVEDAVGSATHDLALPVLALGLGVPGGTPEETIAQWGESCIVGSESVIRQLLANRTLGAARARVKFLDDLYPSRRILLFALGSDPKWINPRQKLIVQGGQGESIQPSTAILYVRKARAKAAGMGS
jgi:type VI secretion system protein ImpJ